MYSKYEILFIIFSDCMSFLNYYNSGYSTPQVTNEDNENSQSNNEVLEDDDECNV